MNNLRIGDRVSRLLYLDDGTWDVQGDFCLKDIPLKYGTVTRVFGYYEPRDIVEVRFDDGIVKRYFKFGVRKVKE